MFAQELANPPMPVEMWSYLAAVAIQIVVKIVGAIVAFFVGRWLIGYVIRFFEWQMKVYDYDPTLMRYLASTLSVLLRAALVVAILGYFGLETTAFAALLAGIGLAIGTAWGGLLANFAGGVFLLFLRPFNVGDRVRIAGVSGKVSEIGIFLTTVTGGDNVINYIGNNKILAETIQNFSANKSRCVSVKAQLAHGVDPLEAIEKLKENVAQIPEIFVDEGISVNIGEFSPLGAIIAIEVKASPDDFDKTLFALNRVIVETFGQAGYPVPEQHFHVRSQTA